MPDDFTIILSHDISVEFLMNGYRETLMNGIEKAKDSRRKNYTFSFAFNRYKPRSFSVFTFMKWQAGLLYFADLLSAHEHLSSAGTLFFEGDSIAR